MGVTATLLGKMVARPAQPPAERDQSHALENPPHPSGEEKMMRGDGHEHAARRTNKTVGDEALQ